MIKYNLRHIYRLLLVISFVSSCLLFVIVASESTKSHETSTSAHPTNERLSSKNVKKIISDTFGSPSNDVKTKENEVRKVKERINEGPKVKQSGLGHENVLNPDKKCTIVPEPTKKEYFDAGDVAHEVVFLEAASKNSGVIQNNLPDIPASPPLINLVSSSELRVTSDLPEHADDSLKNATTFAMLTKIESGQASLTSTPDITSVAPESDVLETLPEEVPVSDVEVESAEEPPQIKDEIALEKETDTNNTEDGTIPVFSEWAQKQMAEAEQKQKEEEENGSIAIPKSTRQNNQKHQVVKLRAKNYASPDCGAKILASNTEAQSTGSVLTASKDEYLLSPCTSRIWFVVELCEPIQAEKIDLANFELFSSSPKNFSVSVSNRFPTRDWSNVGHFTAMDERDVQTFVLHPQLFGKFVRVDIQSHYNSEHYCPVSLFRVYGTSEFEAFETENQPMVIATPEDIDDDEEEYGEGNAVFEPSIDEPERHKRKQKKGQDEKNILKTAKDAVMNMVKKAAEALAKTNEHQNRTVKVPRTRECVSLITPFLCQSCPTQLSAAVQQTAACYDDVLTTLVTNPFIVTSLTQNSNLCAIYVDSSLSKAESPPVSSLRRNYVTMMLPLNYSIGICNKLYWTTLKSSHSEEKVYEVPLVPQPEEIDARVNDSDASTTEDTATKTDPNPQIVTQDTENETLQGDNVSNEERIFQHVEDVQPPLDSGETEPHSDVVTLPSEISSSEQDPEPVIDIPPVAPIDGGSTENKTGDESSQESGETNKSEETSAQETAEINGNNSWENLETLLVTNGHGNDFVPTVTPMINHKQGQPESVFLRLSNRIKSLERNMSLSGQYLEELSRRYKKQVEELQQSFAKTLHHIEEQNRKNTDREQHLYEQNLQMRHDLNEVMDTLHNWKAIVMYCGGFIALQSLFLIFLLRNCFRRNNLLTEALEATLAATKKKKKNKGDLKRRKSIDGTVTHHISPAIRRRRPSEEALKISGTYEDLLIAGSNVGDDVRNIGSGSDGADFVEVVTSSKKKKNKDKVRKTSTGSRVSKRSGSGGELSNTGPAEYDIKNGNLIRCNTNDNNTPIEEMPYLEDNDEFIIPTASELSYNEYVPSMSSSQRINGLDSSISDTSSHRSSNTKLDKSRRLSSPAFFKSALARTSTRKSLPPVVQSSGWEWYRLRKSKAKSESPDVISVGAGSNILSTSTPIDKSGSSDETSNKSKKAGGSFRRILKKVF